MIVLTIIFNLMISLTAHLLLKEPTLSGLAMVILNSNIFHTDTHSNFLLSDPRDGIYTYRDPVSNDILLESIENRESQVFVQEKDLVSVTLTDFFFYCTHSLYCIRK